MVPMDVPDVAADMLHRFVSKLEFNDKVQTVETTRLNATDLEVSFCYSPSVVSDTDTSLSTLDQISGNNSQVHIGIAWLWVALVIAAVSSVLAVCVTIACLRSRKHGQDHEMITQVSDDEDVNQIDEDEEEYSDEDEGVGERVPVNSVSQRATSPRSRVTEV
ncbi:hypothetical protein PPTG_19907 [Phytophthora nicotianae INRA-310]|uniref:Uncharacterized protein n=2 Tax=Phytophthora nicotianae TaxID=4792 RepID=W2PCM9_PHYN3|nr:hypothetical protein PPTG_19907 [Phytophthora nicotianae INRA-310]ETM97978.1 hypothetical protein PPTG_19907 [Phytophthora nicotianae INRA-310]